MRKFVVPVVFVAASLGFAGTAVAATNAQASPNACFGEYSSTFATTHPQSGRLVSGLATWQPKAIGTVASTKPTEPTGCP